MASVSLWSNVAIAVQSALAAAVTVSSITKANPAVVSYTGTDPTNGAYVLISSQGMSQIDARVFRVANVNTTADTFELEGVNSTTFDTFTSGSFQVITFGTSLSTATSLSASGGDFEFIDTTTIHDNVRKQQPGVASAAVYSFENVWDVSDAGLIALKAASDSQEQRAVRITFANGQKVVFVGYIGCTLLPVGNAQDKVTTPTTITMNGRPTTYAT